MCSDNFVQHMFQKATELIEVEQNKRQRAHDKLDFNLKRMLDHLPQQLKQMKVEHLLNQFEGDLDLAARKLVKGMTLEESSKMYMSPPKNESKKRNIKKRSGQEIK